MRIIDVHTHVYPDAIAYKAAQSVRDYYQTGDNSISGTVSTLLQYAEKAGSPECVILPVAVKPNRTRHINEFILEQMALHKTFYGFGTIHAAMEQLPEEVDYILSRGFYGLKFHPDCQGFAIDDPRLYPVYEQIQGKLPVLYHMGDTKSDFSHPARLRKVLKAFPGLQVIAAHFGGHRMQEIAREELSDTNCFFDTSSSMMFMEPGEPEKYICHYGAERFVYGSDYPMWNPEQETAEFMKLRLTDAQLEQIAWKTAAELLHL